MERSFLSSCNTVFVGAGAFYLINSTLTVILEFGFVLLNMLLSVFIIVYKNTANRHVPHGYVLKRRILLY